jgi:hypothetical protein
MSTSSPPHSLLLVLLLGAALAAHAADPAAADIGPYNLGYATFGDSIPTARWVVARVEERSQGNDDLNGDGDTSDQVLHLIEPRGREAVNLGLAVDEMAADDRAVVFAVRERDQAHSDLNGDGDWLDSVLHSHDFGTGELVNLELAGAPLWLSEGRALVVVDEKEHFGQDLNGDGDAFDLVLHLVGVQGGALNLGLAVDGPHAQVQADGRVAAFLVSEREQGQDLNGDGDLSDRLLGVIDLAHGTQVQLLGPATFLRSTVRVSDPWVVYPGTSSGPSTLHVIDLRSGQIVDLGVPAAANAIAMHGSSLVFGARVGNDMVLHVYDAESGVLRNVGESIRSLDFDGAMVAFLTESREPRAFTPDNGVVGVKGVVSDFGSPHGPLGFYPWVLYGARETTGEDLNGDGDFDDEVAGVFDATAPEPINLGLSLRGNGYSTRHCGVVTVSEAEQGADLNRDGDLEDTVPHALDPRSGRLISLGVALWSLPGTDGYARRPAALLFKASERNEQRDLNGDGDTFDFVLFNACPPET